MANDSLNYLLIIQDYSIKTSFLVLLVTKIACTIA